MKNEALDFENTNRRRCAQLIWDMIPDKCKKLMKPIKTEFINAVIEAIENNEMCVGQPVVDTEANEVLPDVINRRELLLAFADWHNNSEYEYEGICDGEVDKFLKANNSL